MTALTRTGGLRPNVMHAIWGLIVSICVLAAAPAVADNSCLWAFDNDCDEPGIGTGLCAAGTDDADCRPGSGGGSSSGLANPCPFTNDGDCDEPNGLNLCAWGTDTADCSNPNSNFGNGSGFAGVRPTTPARPIIPSTQEGRNLQIALNYFGFNAGVVDGQVGRRTRAAIERYQASQGYPINGRNLTPDQSEFLLGAPFPPFP